MKKNLSLSTIEKGLKDEDWRVRAAAMNACQGREWADSSRTSKENDWMWADEMFEGLVKEK